jgi:hypothetical protein
LFATLVFKKIATFAENAEINNRNVDPQVPNMGDKFVAQLQISV